MSRAPIVAAAILLLATPALSCRGRTPRPLAEQIPDSLLAASEVRCGEQRLLRAGPGGRIRLTPALDAALLRVRPVRLPPADAAWMLQEGWDKAAASGSAIPASLTAVEKRATMRIPGLACAGFDPSKARAIVALGPPPAAGGGGPAAVRIVSSGATLAEGSAGGASTSALLELEGRLASPESLLEVVSEVPGAFALQGIALPLGRAQIEVDHEYRDSFVASSVREAAFRLVTPPRAQLRFGIAIVEAPAGIAQAKGGDGDAAPAASTSGGIAGRTGGWTFVIRASGGAGDREVFRETITGGGAGRWLDRRADLSAWAGDEITLTLGAEPSGAEGGAPPLALWGSPIIDSGRVEAGAAPAGAAREKEKPDILLISVDTLRGDRVGRMNGTHEVTPVLDALARAGVRFTQCRTQAPSTLYGHAAILTGLPPAVHGATTSSALPGEIPYLPDLLARDGYATAALTDDGLLDGRFGLSRGFDSFRNRFEPVEEKVAAAMKAIADLPEPWFLFLHTYQVHVPYEPPPETARAFTAGDGGSFGLTLDARTMIRINNGVVPVTPADVRHIENLYDAQVNRTDAALGRLFDTLKLRGLWDATIVAVTADHGEEFDEHGVVGWHSLHCYEEVARVPLILKPAGAARGGSRIDTAVRSIDIAPTLLDLAGAGTPGTMWGATLTGLLRGGREKDRETTCEIEDGRGAAIYVDGWKYHARSDAVAADPRTFRRRVSLRGRYGTEELYDLRADPGEQHDLAGEVPDRARAMGDLLKARLEAGRAALAALTQGHPPLPRPREDDEHLRQLKALGYAR